MISFFNKLGNSWIAKGIFFLLGLSMMAFWGLGGISNTSTSDGTALKVGKNKVSLQEVSHTFDQERNKMARISGGYMTPKRAIQAGLLEQVVQQLALRELNAQIRDEIGLIASDDAVRKYIEQNPVFRDSLGKFDANLFYSYLSGMNMSQEEFAHQMRSELANQHLARVMIQAVPRDKDLMTKMALAKKEKREVLGVFLPLEKMAISAPNIQELRDYYEAYMEEFKIPEYRTLRNVVLKASDFKNDYDEMYAVSRQLEDLLGTGKSLKEACAELKLNQGQVVTVDINAQDKYGKMQENLKPLLQEAFAVAEGEATSLLDIDGGFMVLGLEKITPQSYKNFEVVQNEVVKLWQQEQRKDMLKKVSDDLLTSLQQGKGWKGYAPKSYIISQTELGVFPKDASLLQQKVGAEYTMLLPTDKGVWVVYTKRLIPSKEIPSEAEKAEAVKDWSTDLLQAVQHAYTQKYPIEVHQNVIQKAFSIYETQEE